MAKRTYQRTLTIEGLTAEERSEAVWRAYDNLTPDCRAKIDRLADRLVEAAKKRNERIQLSRSGAIEALAACGLVLAGGRRA